MLDMDRRIRPVRRASFGVLALTLIASGSWLGWWTLVPLALAAVVFRIADGLLDRLERPELGLFCAWAPLALVVSVAMMQSVVMRSDVETHAAAPIDPLTGLLNRKALESRVAEVTQQAAVTGAPVGVIVGDLDHFKDVNDTHGHATGDAVLREPFSDVGVVTISFGYAGSTPGGPFDYAAMFADADAALYEAKAAGRDRVRPPVAAARTRAA